MSLTSYRAAPPRGGELGYLLHPAWRPGGDLLSRALRHSTMGAEVFHGRVRDGIGCINLAMTTGPPGRMQRWKEVCVVDECGLMLRAASAFADCEVLREFDRVISTA